jgi:mono/diheme cytochrome c family protein
MAGESRKLLHVLRGPALFLLLAVPEALAAGDVEEGRAVAQKWCARCHVVGTAKLFGGIDSTPTFFLMSEQLERYRPRVLTLKARRPHKSLDLDDVSNDDLENLVAYIATLERP